MSYFVQVRGASARAIEAAKVHKVHEPTRARVELEARFAIPVGCRRLFDKAWLCSVAPAEVGKVGSDNERAGARTCEPQFGSTINRVIRSLQRKGAKAAIANRRLSDSRGVNFGTAEARGVADDLHPPA